MVSIKAIFTSLTVLALSHANWVSHIGVTSSWHELHLEKVEILPNLGAVLANVLDAMDMI